MCYSSSLRRLNPSRLTFGPSLRLAGPSSGGLVSDHQPKRWPHCVVISRQIPAPVGEDQGAHHPGGGTGDGEVADRADTDDFTAHRFSAFIDWARLYLDRREKQSLRRAWPKETRLWWVLKTSCHHQQLSTVHQTLTVMMMMIMMMMMMMMMIAICSQKQPMWRSCIIICSALKDKQQFTCLF